MEIIKFKLNDLIELKKPHPCGSKQFKILRIGSDIRIICQGCGRDMVMDRIKLEKAIKTILSTPDESSENQ